MSVTSCLVQHFGAKSPIAAYRSDMAADVAELVADGMAQEAAWLQVVDAKLADLKSERTRIEQSVADGYAKTAAGKPAPEPAAKPEAQAVSASAAEAPAATHKDPGKPAENAPPDVRSPEADQQAAKADVAERRRKTAEAVRASVVKKTNANSAMVWQIINPDGDPMSGPPGKYPGRELLGGTATMGDLGWGTKREAEAALAELNRKADEILGAKAPEPQPVTETAAEAPPATQAAAILDAAPDPFADNYAALDGKTITQQVLVADTGKTATLRMDAGQALRDVGEREQALVKLKACVGL